MKNFTRYLGLGLLAFSISACAVKNTGKKSVADSSHKSAVTCSFKGETRTIENRSAGKGCEVAYTKGGKTTVAAKSSKGMNHCNQVTDKMTKNLTAGGWTCK